MGWMDSLDSILHIAVVIGVWVAEIIGVLIAVVTVVQALWGWIYHKERVRLLLGEGISLALQFKLAGEVQIYPQVLKNVRVEDKQAVLDNEAVQAAAAKVTEELGDNGRLLLRPSGTEPVVRVMVEAADMETCERCADAVIQVMKEQGLCK